MDWTHVTSARGNRYRVGSDLRKVLAAHRS
jgi:hypothetical protein